MLIRFAELFLVFRYLSRAENFYFKINVVVIVNPEAGNFTILGDDPAGAGSTAKGLVYYPRPGSKAGFKEQVHMHAPLDFFEVYTMNGFEPAGKQFAAGLYSLHAVIVCG